MVLYTLLFVPIDVSYVGRNGVSILAVTLIAMRSIVWYMRFLGVYFLLVHNPCVCFRIKIHYYGLAKYIEFCSFILLAGSGTRLESERSAPRQPADNAPAPDNAPPSYPTDAALAPVGCSTSPSAIGDDTRHHFDPHCPCVNIESRCHLDPRRCRGRGGRAGRARGPPLDPVHPHPRWLCLHLRPATPHRAPPPSCVCQVARGRGGRANGSVTGQGTRVALP